MMSIINFDFSHQPAYVRPANNAFNFYFGSVVPHPKNYIGIEQSLAWITSVAINLQLDLNSDSARNGSQITSRWESDNATESDVALDWSLPPALSHILDIPWHQLPTLQRNSSVSWMLPQAFDRISEVTFRTGAAFQQNNLVYWATFGRYDQQVAAVWHDAHWRGSNTEISYSYFDHRGVEPPIAWGPHLGRWVCSDAYQPPSVGRLTIRFDEPFASSASPLQLRFEHLPMVCVWVPPSQGHIDAPNPPLPPIDFKVPIQPQIRRLYLMQPVLTCHRVSDNLQLVIKSVGITDARSQFVSTASIEFSSKGDAILASNQLLRININGYDFYVISEQPSKREAWNSGSYSSSGRSKAAELLMPWRSAVSYSNSAARSFAGVLSDLLENTGWTVALQGITDFTIPAGVATISDKTPLESAAEFAGMVGCFLAPDDENNVINILPRWPTVPWQMDSATPDVIIHDAVIIDYSSNETISQQCNAAWVRGEQQGVDAKVTLNGTAGNVPTDDIANVMIVDIQAARIAGTSAIADTGNKQQIAVTMPIMADLPPLKKGQLIGVTWRGENYRALCDSIGITASVDDNGAVTVRQQATLLRPME